MNRFWFAHIGRWLLHLHYRVEATGQEVMCDGRVHLLLPNHTAFIDPLIVATENWRVPLCPLSDERFVRHPVWGRFLRVFTPIEVPDLTVPGHLHAGAEQAAQLTKIARNALAEGKELLIYPSGHIKTTDCEQIGNRRLAYELCRDLPEGVEVVLLRMRGLETSHWSKLEPKQWLWRRRVSMHYEDMTSQLRNWATTLDRRTFNQHLESWYNCSTLTTKKLEGQSFIVI